MRCPLKMRHPGAGGAVAPHTFPPSRGSNRAFTLIEISVVMLIFTLILYGAMKLMIVAADRFGHQEEAILFAAEAATIISRMRADLENTLVKGDDPWMFEHVAPSVTFKDEVLTFPVRIGSADKSVSYVLDRTTRSLIRQFDGKAVSMGKGMVDSFFAVFQVFTGEGAGGVVRSFPGDPDNAAPEAPAPPPGTPAVRAWIKIKLALQGQSRNAAPVRQEYVFRVHPVRLNRQIQSLWASPPAPPRGGGGN